MKNKNLAFLIGIVAFVATVSAALTAFFIVKDKQKKMMKSLWSIWTTQLNNLLCYNGCFIFIETAFCIFIGKRSD